MEKPLFYVVCAALIFSIFCLTMNSARMQSRRGEMKAVHINNIEQMAKKVEEIKKRRSLIGEMKIDKETRRKNFLESEGIKYEKMRAENEVQKLEERFAALQKQKDSEVNRKQENELEVGKLKERYETLNRSVEVIRDLKKIEIKTKELVDDTEKKDASIKAQMESIKEMKAKLQI